MYDLESLKNLFSGVALQNIIIIHFFNINKNRSLSRHEIYNYYCSCTDEDVKEKVPTFILDRLDNLEELQLIKRVKSTDKSIKYTLDKLDHRFYFDIRTSKNKFLPFYKQIISTIEQYSEFPISPLLETVLEDFRVADEHNYYDDGYKIIDFEKPYIKNYKKNYFEIINALYYAISNKHIIKKIVYSGSYLTGDNKPVKTILKNFKSYLLKQSRGQWYLIGKAAKSEKLSAIAINRILDIDCDEDQTFERDKTFNAEAYWKGTVGITGFEDPLDIKFKIKNGSLYNNIDYIMQVPIINEHQTINKVDENWHEVVLKDVYFGPELVRVLRTYGKNNFKDISPHWINEDLWEDKQLKDISFSIKLNSTENTNELFDMIRDEIKANQANVKSAINIEPINNKKMWYKVTIENVVVDSLIYFLSCKLIKKYTDENIKNLNKIIS